MRAWGGVKFVCQLLKGQGFIKESEYIEQRLKVLNGQSESTTIPPWWQVYDRPEQVRGIIVYLLLLILICKYSWTHY